MNIKTLAMSAFVVVVAVVAYELGRRSANNHPAIRSVGIAQTLDTSAYVVELIFDGGVTDQLWLDGEPEIFINGTINGQPLYDQQPGRFSVRTMHATGLNRPAPVLRDLSKEYAKQRAWLATYTGPMMLENVVSGGGYIEKLDPGESAVIKAGP